MEIFKEISREKESEEERDRGRGGRETKSERVKEKSLTKFQSLNFHNHELIIKK